MGHLSHKIAFPIIRHVLSIGEAERRATGDLNRYMGPTVCNGADTPNKAYRKITLSHNSGKAVAMLSQGLNALL